MGREERERKEQLPHRLVRSERIPNVIDRPEDEITINLFDARQGPRAGLSQYESAFAAPTFGQDVQVPVSRCAAPFSVSGGGIGRSTGRFPASVMQVVLDLACEIPMALHIEPEMEYLGHIKIECPNAPRPRHPDGRSTFERPTRG